jgi:hypothetical protein
MLSNSDNDERGSVCWLKFTLEKLWGGASILMQYGVLRAEKPGVQWFEWLLISTHNLMVQKSVRQIAHLSILFLTICRELENDAFHAPCLWKLCFIQQHAKWPNFWWTQGDIWRLSSKNNSNKSIYYYNRKKLLNKSVPGYILMTARRLDGGACILASNSQNQARPQQISHACGKTCRSAQIMMKAQVECGRVGGVFCSLQMTSAVLTFPSLS